MNIEIVQVEKEPRISSRVIADRLGVEHEAVMKHLASYAADFEELGHLRFEIGTVQNSVGAVNQTRWGMLLEDQAYLLLTFARNTPTARACKLAIVQAFKAARAPAPQSLTRADLARMILEAETELEQARTENALNAPKVEAFDEIVSSTGLMSVAQAAKLLGTGEVRLFAILRTRGVLMSREVSGEANHNVPYQRHLDAGQFEIKVRTTTLTSGRQILTSTTYVTGSGLEYIRKLLRAAQPELNHASLECAS
jgi:anti-repressor protein